jgi:adenine deaminase
MSERRFTARVVDLDARTIELRSVTVREGRIAAFGPPGDGASRGFLVPGFVDAHVHVESSMMPPSEFARVAVRHGTVAAVSDPHEIANVLGVAGVEFMLRDAARRPFRFCFGAPSCVPATAFETAGAVLDAAAVSALLADPRIGYLSEMMHWPGAIAGDREVMAKIAAAVAIGKPVDGHAPQLAGDDARLYAAAGISTDHECTSLEEARHKASLGMRIAIREGSAARNFEALWPLLREFPGQCMFCTDDAHPDVLAAGHVNRLVARAVAKGIDRFDALRAACVVPVEHYRIPCGQLRIGDAADFAVVRDLEAFEAIETSIGGEIVFEAGRDRWSPLPVETPNRFREATFTAADFALPAVGASVAVRTIEPADGELVTGEGRAIAPVRDGVAEADSSQDLALIAVANRYEEAPPAVAFIRGFGIGEAAIAASVAHDCHNVVAVGGSRALLAAAVNEVFAAKGGLAVAHRGGTRCLPLPIAGLMSDRPFEAIARDYEAITEVVRGLGSPLRAPFMTLSFMALLVIPALKLGDRGLFDGQAFRFVPVFA